MLAVEMPIPGTMPMQTPRMEDLSVGNPMFDRCEHSLPWLCDENEFTGDASAFLGEDEYLRESE